VQAAGLCETKADSGSGVLVIVPCGRVKIWDKDPDHGPAAAKDAYTGILFRLNRAYAERYGNDWVILSAKYGFISPNFVIPESYEVTFNRRRSSPITSRELRRQVKPLDRYSVVVGLGRSGLSRCDHGCIRRFPHTLSVSLRGATYRPHVAGNEACFGEGRSRLRVM
jgi:hypothetical protein